VVVAYVVQLEYSRSVYLLNGYTLQYKEASAQKPHYSSTRDRDLYFREISLNKTVIGLYSSTLNFELDPRYK